MGMAGLQGPYFEHGESPVATCKPLQPEPELDSARPEEFAAVVAATKSSVAHWRDGAWFERYPSGEAAAVPREQRMPPGIGHSDLLRYLAVFAINSWALQHRADRSDGESTWMLHSSLPYRCMYVAALVCLTGRCWCVAQGWRQAPP